jgi:O-acetyl-ADP-ribose deacetylase (regulator of RNase III)
MNIIKGDLIELAEQGYFHIIVHGCNCFCAMASGIAGQISKQYPGAAEIDAQTIRGDRSKLGTFTHYQTDMGFYIINAYTQYTFSRGEDVFEYEAFERFLQNLKQKVITIRSQEDIDSKIRIGFPKIGCGLAGGDFTRVLDILLDFSEENCDIIDVTMVIYPER